MGDRISIILGVISVILAVYSIWLAWRYNKFGQKIEEDKKMITRLLQDNVIYTSVLIRDINEKMGPQPGKIRLHKDELRIWRNSKYNPCKASSVIDKLNKELPSILKQTYIDQVIGNLNLIDDSTIQIAVVTLRHQYNINDINRIKELNTIFEEDGITFDILIS